MSKQKATKILIKHSQRATDKRVELLALLMEKARAFALSEIERLLTISIDRVTIYRTLHIFETIGLVVRMVDYKGVCLYMFNHETHNHINNIHPHLLCNSCQKVICLPCLPNQYMAKIKKYKIKNMYFLMEGLCPECLSNKSGAI